MNDPTLEQLIAAMQQKQAVEQRQQTDRMAGASPEILDLLAEYGLIAPQQEVAAGQMKMADKMRNTPMPEGITVRNQYIAPSVLGVASSTMDRIQGGQDYEREKQALMAGFMRKMKANRAFGQEEQDAARRQLAAEAAAEPVPGAGEGIVTPREDAALTDVIPSGEPYYGDSLRPKAPGKKAPAGQAPVLLPGMTMSPNVQPPLPTLPGETMTPTTPNPFKPRSPFRGYQQGGLWPLPGGK